MKRYIFLFIIFLSVNVSFASSDFFRFDNGYNFIGERDYLNRVYPSNRVFNKDKYFSTYYCNTPANVFNGFKQRRIEDADIIYLLSKMEKTKLGRINDNLDIETRLDKLDTVIFGMIQSGDNNTRLNRLRQAFSAESINNYKYKQRNLLDLKGFFSSGYPTSMPMPDSYYSAIGGY